MLSNSLAHFLSGSLVSAPPSYARQWLLYALAPTFLVFVYPKCRNLTFSPKMDKIGPITLLIEFWQHWKIIVLDFFNEFNLDISKLTTITEEILVRTIQIIKTHIYDN